MLKKKIRIKQVTALLVVLLVLLIIRLRFILNDTKIISAATSNYTQNEIVSDENYRLLDVNYKEITNYNEKFIVNIDSVAFALNNVAQNTNNLLNFYYVMQEEDSDFSFYDISKLGGMVKYEIKEESYIKLLNIVDSLKGVYLYKYNEAQNKTTWSIENILKTTTSFSDNKEKDGNSLEVFIKESTKNNTSNIAVFEKNEDGSYSVDNTEQSEINIDVQLTLDSNLQEITRQVLNREEFLDFPNIGAVIIESDTGKVLSLAQKDETQPNLVTGGGKIEGYEPGSIFKIITLEAAMNYLDINLSDIEICSGKRCSKIHGELTILDAFKVSCNEVFTKLGTEVGEDKLMKFAKEQGLFQNLLGLDVESGMEIIGKYDESGTIDNLSIGQSMQSNLLQMTSLISTIVNNGTYVKPYIVDNFLDVDKNIVNDFQGEKKQVISKDIANNIKYAMNETVLSGTANIANIHGIEIGAKTGTAETSNGSNLHGWFIGYYNIDNKYYSIGVFVPNIKGIRESTGGSTAGPVFKEIALALKEYYNKN